jgi:hypothetical protein
MERSGTDVWRRKTGTVAPNRPMGMKKTLNRTRRRQMHL